MQRKASECVFYSLQRTLIICKSPVFNDLIDLNHLVVNMLFRTLSPRILDYEKAIGSGIRVAGDLYASFLQCRYPKVGKAGSAG